MPLVSVIVPVYNAERWLRPCADSILAQTLGDFELIFVDDASTDASCEILMQYAAKDERVKLLRHDENRYAGVARNTGMDAALGEYLLFLDADDLYEPELLALAVDAARRDDADIVLFGADMLDADGAFRADPFQFSPELWPPGKIFCRDDAPEEIFQLCMPEPWTKLLRRDFIGRLGLRFADTQNANDLYFTMAALAEASRIGTVPAVLTHHRAGLPGSVQTCRSRQPLAFYEALRALRERLSQKGLLPTLSKSFANLALFHCNYNADAGADWPAVFAELGVTGRPKSDFTIPNDFDRYVSMTLASEHFSPDGAAYGEDFWREAWRLEAEGFKAAETARLENTRRAELAETELALTKRSASFRLGSLATWPLRKLRSILGDR